MISDKYSDLPDYIESSQLSFYFDELLRIGSSGSQVDIADVALAFSELADRQWHTYSLASEDIRQRVTQWFHQHWNALDISFIQRAASVAGCLGLPEIVADLHSTLSRPDLPEALRSEIIAALRELTERVDDPFSDLRGLSSP